MPPLSGGFERRGVFKLRDDMLRSRSRSNTLLKPSYEDSRKPLDEPDFDLSYHAPAAGTGGALVPLPEEACAALKANSSFSIRRRSSFSASVFPLVLRLEASEASAAVIFPVPVPPAASAAETASIAACSTKPSITWALMALRRGNSIEETAVRLGECSGNAKENGDNYALRTAQNAAAVVERERQRGRA